MTTFTSAQFQAFAGHFFDGPIAYMAAEVNWPALLQHNAGSKAQLLDAFVGELLRSGFEARTSFEEESDASSDSQALLTTLSEGNRKSDIYLAKPR